MTAGNQLWKTSLIMVYSCFLRISMHVLWVTTQIEQGSWNNIEQAGWQTIGENGSISREWHMWREWPCDWWATLVTKDNTQADLDISKWQNRKSNIPQSYQWKRSIQDVKTRILADAGSDNILTIGKLAQKLWNVKAGEKKKQHFDTAKLQNPVTKREFTIMLKDSFSILQEEPDMIIHRFNKNMEIAGSKTIQGYRRVKKDQWISASTWTKSDKEKKQKIIMLTTKSPILK